MDIYTFAGWFAAIFVGLVSRFFVCLSVCSACFFSLRLEVFRWAVSPFLFVISSFSCSPSVLFSPLLFCCTAWGFAWALRQNLLIYLSVGDLRK